MTARQPEMPDFSSQAPRLLTPAEVAALLRVDPKTVTRWARGGKLAAVRTPGGHRRYSEDQVLSFIGDWDRGKNDSAANPG